MTCCNAIAVCKHLSAAVCVRGWYEQYWERSEAFPQCKELNSQEIQPGLGAGCVSDSATGYIWSPTADDMDLVCVVLIIVKVSQNRFVELPVRDSDSDFT